MASRTMIRWAVWALFWTVAVLATRPAHAAAPMCDERGASAIAPPPILQARDVKIDAAPFGCDGPDFVMTRIVARARTGGGVVVDDIAFQEAWVRPATERLPSPMSGQALAGAQDSFPASSAHVRGVFRPPRS